MQSELIIATYNKPKHLRVVLNAVPSQIELPDCICIADDGSGAETRDVISAFVAKHPHIQLRHEWHADEGFAKNRILNQAIETSQADHLIFIDDDCVMHPKFIQRHRALAHPERFMAGSVIRLSADITERYLKDNQLDWAANGAPVGWRSSKLSQRLKSGLLLKPLLPLLDRVSPVKKNWAGGNASAHRQALIDVNGFDETLMYGGEDKELGARLTNNGVKGRHIRYTAPLYHLDHGRGYVDAKAQAANRRRIEEVRRDGITFTPHGIKKAV